MNGARNPPSCAGTLGAQDQRAGSSAGSANRLTEDCLSVALTAKSARGCLVPLEDSLASQEVLQFPLIYQWIIRRLQQQFTCPLRLRGAMGEARVGEN